MYNVTIFREKCFIPRVPTLLAMPVCVNMYVLLLLHIHHPGSSSTCPGSEWNSCCSLSRSPLQTCATHVGLFWHQLSFSLTLFIHWNPLQASVVVPNVTASSHAQSSAWLDGSQDLQMRQGSSNDFEFNNHYFKCSLILTNPVPWLTCKN